MLLCESRTDVGLVRKNNEDSYLTRPADGVFAVADGMGGHAAGEIASAIAIKHVADATVANAAQYEAVFRAAHAAILAAARADYAQYGMGTTLTACRIVGDQLYFGHAGDSRLYVVRYKGRGQLQIAQVTKDHGDGPSLDNCLGVAQPCLKSVDCGQIALRSNDVVILASDGLTRYLSHDSSELADVVNQGFRGTASRLVDFALRSGGEDNVTVIAIRYTT